VLIFDPFEHLLVPFHHREKDSFLLVKMRFDMFSPVPKHISSEPLNTNMLFDAVAKAAYKVQALPVFLRE
jgi:hypothetical protein